MVGDRKIRAEEEAKARLVTEKLAGYDLICSVYDETGLCTRLGVSFGIIGSMLFLRMFENFENLLVL